MKSGGRPYPLPIALIMLVIGLLIGLARYTFIYGFTILPLNRLFNIHPHIIIFGFISVVIMFERFRGVGLTIAHKNILILGIIANAISIAFLLMGAWVSQYPIYFIGLYLLLLPPITYTIYLLLNRGHIYMPVLGLHIVSQLFFIASISIEILGIPLDRYSYSLILLSYPILFILGERLELTRFIAPKPIFNKLVYTCITVLSISLILILLYPGYSGYLGYILGLPLMATILTIIPMDPTLKIKSPKEVRMKYLGVHLKLGYIMLILGVLTYYIGKAYYLTMNLYDTYIHLIALGFIGFMLVGHGPIILSSLLNIEVRYSFSHTYILVAAIMLRIFLNLTYPFLPQVGIQALSILSGILVFIALIVFIRNTLIYGMRRIK